MNSLPPLKRASYILHVVTVAGIARHTSNTPSLDVLPLVRLLDEVLALFDTEPRFQHFVLDGQSIFLEDYLSIRPETFERIEALVQDGRLLVGPWYVQTDPISVSVESLIRNLMIGLRTARVFGPPMRVAYMPYASELVPALPQIFKDFGIEVALAPNRIAGEPLERIWEGDDGTRIPLAALPDGVATLDHSIVDRRSAAAPYSDSGHLLLLYVWDKSESYQYRLNWLYSLPAAQRELHDSVFHSHPAAYAKAIEAYVRATPPPVIQSSPTPEAELQQSLPTLRAERAIRFQLEPFAAWIENLPARDEDRHLRHPQQMIQKLWRGYLELLSPAPLQNHSDATEPDIEEKKQLELIRSASELAWRAQMSLAARVNTALLAANGGTEQGILLVVFNPNEHAAIVSVPDALAHLIEFETQEIPPFGYTSLVALYVNPSAEADQQVHAALDLLRNDVDNALAFHIEGIHDGELRPSASVMSVSEAGFHLSVIKLPEEADRTGIIVRGWNVGETPLWIVLTPWRTFSTVEVVTLDESPTGGKLAPEPNGAVRFKAAPHRILTFWFHD